MVLDFYEGEWTFQEGPVVISHGFASINAKSINEIFNFPNKALLGDKIIAAQTKKELKEQLNILFDE